MLISVNKKSERFVLHAQYVGNVRWIGHASEHKVKNKH